MNCEHITQCETCKSNVCSYCVEDCDGCGQASCELCHVAHMKHCPTCKGLVCPKNFAGKMCLSCDAQESMRVE